VLAFAATLAGCWFLAPVATIETVTRWMKANTTVTMAIAAVAALLVLPENVSPRRLLGARVLGSIVLLVGAATLSEYFLGMQFGIDELIRLDIRNPESMAFPGRMAPNAALSFILLGFALLMRDRATRRGSYPSNPALILLLALAALAVVGYLYQATALYQISTYIRISQYTAASFALLTLALLLSRPERGPARYFLSEGPDGALVRGLLPPAVLIPIILCWIAARLRDEDILNRPTAFSLLAAMLVISFVYLVWRSAVSVERIEAERKRIFEQEKRTLATINEVGQSLSAELDLETLLQAVTDAATKLTRAQFGAFFYNAKSAQGEAYTLYTISGVPKEAFAKFPMPRNTEVFAPTFSGGDTVRSDDITKDARYGKNAPYQGMPPGHLPVRSYLATSVVSRGGEVIGGLFFGHAEVAQFSEQDEKLVEGLASQAAVAVDNARLYQSLQETLRARDEFLSIASHELKTPLTSLTLQSQLRRRQLAKGGLDSLSIERMSKQLEGDARQLSRLNTLIDDMLDISRIRTGQLRLHRARLELGALTKEVLERFDSQLVEACGSVEALIEQGLEVTGDPFRLEQVIANLLTNAMKYGAGKPVVVSAARSKSGTVVLSVRDRGIGISEEDQKRIFARFERAVPSGVFSGMGLGLAIAKDIVEAHGGTIRVESRLGEGSVFSVELPKAAEDSLAAPA
jgi:signal transduction histidine kinase